MREVFARHGLELFDVERLATHGGSLRIYGKHASDESKQSSARVQELLAVEDRAGLRQIATYTAFAEQVRETKRALLAFLIEAKRAGKRIVGYGAPGKGNTLLNYCGIGTDFIDFTVDRNPYKQGKYTPGMHIPIRHPDELARARPDLVLILPWNLKDEILATVGRTPGLNCSVRSSYPQGRHRRLRARCRTPLSLVVCRAWQFDLRDRLEPDRGQWMTTALVVSRFFPYDTQRVHGLYQRLGTQIQALARVASRVECLFLVPEEQRYTPDALKAHEERLRQLWSPAVSLRIAPTADESVPDSPWERIARGTYDFHSQLIVRSANNQRIRGGGQRGAGCPTGYRPESSPVVDVRADADRRTQTPEKLRGIPVFFDMDDIEHVAAFRRLVLDPRWPAERLLLLQLPRLVLAEVQAMRMSAGTFVCSEGDRRQAGAIPRRHTRPGDSQQRRLPAAARG